MKYGTATAVIGAGFGDEGKGLATDYFARQCLGDKIVARCNGGSQAGHTVVGPDGERHIFGHLGAGTMAGGVTYLAENFIVNPLTFDHEMTALAEMGFTDMDIFLHPRSRVTTIYDMAINSIAELNRGAARHGSCGMGINETVTRHAAGFRFVSLDLNEPPSVIEYIMEKIHTEWVPIRLDQLKLKLGDSVYDDVLRSKDYRKVAKDIYEAGSGMRIGEHIEDVTDCDVIIEGAQGLRIDEFLGSFPHVTRSVTGLPSHIKAAAELFQTAIDPVYITRAYATRHGAGPLQFEGIPICDHPIVDRTNVTNTWQQGFRLAPLDVDDLAYFIRQDLERAHYVAQVFGITINEPVIFLTCLDQVGNRVNVKTDGTHSWMTPQELIESIERRTRLKVRYTSHGPAASDVKDLQSGV